MYIWEHERWPEFGWNDKDLSSLLRQVSRGQARLLGRMEALGFEQRSETQLRALTEDVLRSSEIEGEHLPADQVRSSIARRLGLEVAGLVRSGRAVDGVVEMLLDATTRYADPLTMMRLFAWHAALFPAGRSGLRKINVGTWRDDSSGPMQVVSGPLGRQTIHYEAPPAARLADEMDRFLTWFEAPGDIDPLLAAGLAHLWFVTIHPFDDGNGRIARAIADMALARSEQSDQRYYSMSAQIRRERADYYRMLEQVQQGPLDVTRWQEWFLGCLLRAIEATQETLGTVLAKAHFWERFAKVPMNERQIKVLNKLLDGFAGKLTTSKWARIAGCSQDTAYRDILALIDRGALIKDAGGGRSTNYSLNPSAAGQ
jgi:Fic family protein